MKKPLLFVLVFGFLLGCQTSEKKENMNNPSVNIHTNLGDIVVELYEDKAPITVKNFLRYVEEKHYDHTIFHRVIDGFMVQGGGFSADMEQKAVHEPIRNEADHRLSNKTGTIAMARTSEIHSATSQFFINVTDNEFLDFKSPTPAGYGYCVFGKVIKGMDVVEKIKTAKTGSKKGHKDVPIETVEIFSIKKVG